MKTLLLATTLVLSTLTYNNQALAQNYMYDPRGSEDGSGYSGGSGTSGESAWMSCFTFVYNYEISVYQTIDVALQNAFRACDGVSGLYY